MSHQNLRPTEIVLETVLSHLKNIFATFYVTARVVYASNFSH